MSDSTTKTPPINGHAPDVRNEAIVAEGCGISVCPPREDGSKSPDRLWKELQARRANLDDIRRWYGTKGLPKRTGLGVICGKVSGNLEVLEFDRQGQAYEAFKTAAAEIGLGDTVERIEAGYLERTPSGGIHWFYYCDTIAGNTALARYESDEINPATGRPIIKPLIETRGEGGYVVTAPSNGTVHPTGGAYELICGGFRTIARITAEERKALFDLARSFDELPQSPDPAETKARKQSTGGWDDVVSPIDDFNERADFDSLLPGWTAVYQRGGTTYLRRPGKDRGVSATIRESTGRLYVFSTSTEFEAQKPYSKFAAYARLNHGNDFKASFQALSRQGYGSFKGWAWEDRDWVLRTLRNPCPTGGKVRIARPGAPKPPPFKEPGARKATAEAANGDGATVNGTHYDANGDASGPDREKAGDAEAKGLDRIPVEITPMRYEVLQQTIAVLARGDKEIYSRGESLVTIAGEPEDEVKLTRATTLARTAGASSVVILSDAVLGCRLTRTADFWQQKTSKNGEPYNVDVHPPDWLIAAVATHKRWPGIRPLIGISDCPFPRADGTLVVEPGYDAATGYYFRPSIRFPEVPDRPTREDARAAWGRLRRIIGQFPFHKDDDRAVWLAGLLTKIARPGIHGPVPGIVVVGNKPSTGKGLLVDTIGITCDGRPVPTTAYPVDPIEAAKVDLAIAVSGKGIIHYDNIEEGSTYGNAALDSAMTSITVDGRILGTSRMTGEIDRRVVTLASGNNISPGKDAHRRWLPCNLFSDLERPEERDDIEVTDLRSHLMEHRADYVRDVLVILKAHALAGRPRGAWSPLGSFENWDQVVRGAVWYATGLDCCATRRAAADEAPARMAKMALLEGWLELPDGRATATKAVESASSESDDYPILRNALMHFGRDGKLATARSLGNIIRGMKGNLIDGRMFVQHSIEHSAIVWGVKQVHPSSPKTQNRGGTPHPGGESGESGESDSHYSRASFPTDKYVKMCGATRKTCGPECKQHSPDSPDSPPAVVGDDREVGEI